MQAKDIMRWALQESAFLLTGYLGDLSDNEMVTRPVASANHTAWQVGHLIASEQRLVRGDVPSAAYPELPSGFVEKHGKDGVVSEQGFLSAAQYTTLFKQNRAATITAMMGLADADLDKARTGPLSQIAPTVGSLFMLVSNHTLLHGGQVVVTRRRLGKPVIF